MGRVRSFLAVLTVVCLLGGGVPAVNAEEDSLRECRELLLQYYCYYQADASREIEDCLNMLEAEDPQQGRLWRRIMEDWDRLNQADFTSALPEGLPGDDSLCIVVFGFGLNDNGSMKPELLDRLRTALDVAREYPNALVAVTGGETSAVSGVSEAGEMAAWLRSNGVADSRVVVEAKALSTTENAQKTYDILIREYPQVRQAVVVTSDYHAPWAAVMLQTVSTYESMVHGTREIPVAAGVSCATGTPYRDTLSSQAWGIGLITGTHWTGSRPERAFAPQERALPPETETVTQQTEAVEQPGMSLTDKILGWLFRK